ncbi:vitamin K-dependent gamma-carboxylase-like [Mizuhopecten yessoensis]|uniref:Vitamin K-dependent gamma-carboxylase n=1 Tax=Mizuhopecten yessoensis TaxID=6573 RepID=A0A210PMY6_MIZYE|nr:vitamin K-dependent gamma-carboxylase-like [Mizuhopecten yessoensis]OWF37824.1 Vitamin K-dependent gamma-carboxylase [Mizuhopecten yessoensis]
MTGGYSLRHRGRTSKGLREPVLQTDPLTPSNGNDGPGNHHPVLGFNLCELTSFVSVVKLLCRPTDSASLGVTRFMFGLLMVIDIPQERGMGVADVRWGDPSTCHFPLFDWLRPLPLVWMYVVYLVMLLGAIGIMLGLLYRLSCVMFLVTYWYVFLLDKTSWNNHSYLYGLIALILLLCDANRCWSLDGWLRPQIRHCHVPLWNYTLLRSQVFLVYFIAGLKKLDMDWISGYSMQYLSSKWVFDPFRLFLTDDQIDLYIVHICGLMLDMFIGFFLFFDKTRPVALFFGSSFHFMNSQLFNIGMFSYTMLATLPLFCYPDWPRRVLQLLPLPGGPTTRQELQPNSHCVYVKELVKSSKQIDKPQSVSSSPQVVPPTAATFHHKLFSCVTLFYLSTQVFLPYSHCITKGYNTWTDGLYGYSWDMMVHSWKTQHVRLTYMDLDTGEQGYLDPYAWVPGKSSRWSSHADMVKQYMTCIADRLVEYNITNVELYIDVWRSLNDRFQQRVFNPNIDLLRAPWGPFSKVSFAFPLLVDLSDWRQKLSEIQAELHSSSNYTDVVFVADFPGLTLENYIQPDLGNTSITLLKGEVIVEIVDRKRNYTLTEGQQLQLPADAFHNVHTVSSEPSCYMYIFINTTKELFIHKLEEYRHAINASINGTDTTGELMKQFDGDPYLQHYRDHLAGEGITKKEKTLWQIATHFFNHRYKKFTRSFLFVQAAIKSIVFGESFEDFRESLYSFEVNQKHLEESVPEPHTTDTPP